MLTPVAPAPTPFRTFALLREVSRGQEDPTDTRHPDPETPPHQPPGSTRKQVVAAAKGGFFFA